jgi:anti-anti-sigma factor
MLKIQSKKLDTVAVLSLQGQLVNGEMELLRDAVESLASVSAVKLDLARVTMVDAGGLGVMLALREQAEANGVRFELMNLTKQIGKVFEITHLDSVFRIASGGEFFRAASRGNRAAAAPLRSCA